MLLTLLALLTILPFAFVAWWAWSPSRRIAGCTSAAFDRWYGIALEEGWKVTIRKNPNSVIVMVDRRHAWKFRDGRWYSADFRGQWCWIVGLA